MAHFLLFTPALYFNPVFTLDEIFMSAGLFVLDDTTN